VSGPVANLVNLEEVRLSYGTRTLLDGVSLGVAEGQRLGVVGRNGGGKTTLLEVLARRRSPDGGRVTHTGGLRVGFLSQSDDLDPSRSVRQTVVGDLPEHAWRSDPRTRGLTDALLAGLDLDGVVGPLSGGERRRVALARLLVEDPDLLLLDEPTNHLDVEGVAWLARHLAARRGALVAVTHDRWFLDAVCETTWEVADGEVHAYEGGYASYVLAKAERARVAATTEERRQNLLRKELAWLRRGPPARTSKPQFRIDAANALIADEPPPRDSVELTRFAGARLGKTVYDVEDVSLRFGDRPILADVTWRLGPGDRVGVVGVNGAGKTTLLRLLHGDQAPDVGDVKVGRTVQAAYLSQEVAELPPDLRALAAVEDVRSVVDLGRGREITALQLAERFGFTGERMWTRVGELSGGERRRLQLLRLLMAGPNVLLLDEPTNDLDVETLNALEDLLDGWPGTLVVVSHDRYFLERVCDTVVGLLGDGQVRDLPGGVEEYLRLREQEPALTAVGPAPTAGAGSAGVQSAALSGAPSAADVRAARKELARVERSVSRLTQQAGKLHAQLAEHATDHVRVAELDAELRAVRAEITALEEQWMALAEVAE
jgi:ABC transport system ATP-binding/permease protein